ncbi:hypothetical protein ANO11243_042720 [Dothideomycetidae sp. 11243]|nr:hypothetical protein ANO11243_042720 [fungal sp. No.11243]
MSRAALDSLPIEVFDNVITDLVLDDLRSLRLTARRLAVRIGESHQYASSCRNVTVSLTTDSDLESFVRMTGPGRPAQHMHHLTLKYTVDLGFSPVDRINTSFIRECLATSFANLRLHLTYNRLISLSLQVDHVTTRLLYQRASLVVGRDIFVDSPPPPWQWVWHAAAELFTVTFQALYDSNPAVNAIDIFGSVPRCGLSCGSIETVVDKYMPQSLSSLKCLSISLSDLLPPSHPVESQIFQLMYGRVPPPSSHQAQIIDADVSAAGQKAAQVACRFIDRFPDLESLDLHWSCLADRFASGSHEERHFFQLLAATGVPARLRRLSLKGVFLCEMSLLKFLSKAPHLTHLFMEHIHLKTGNLQPVFDLLASQLEYLHLDDLRAPREVLFNAPHLLNDPNWRIVDWRQYTKLTRRGISASRPISWGVPVECFIASQEWPCPNHIRLHHGSPVNQTYPTNEFIPVSDPLRGS